MKTVAMIAVFMLMLMPAAYSQDWAKAPLNKSPRHLDWVTVKNGKRDVKCFIAYPQVKTKAKAILVIHEIFGLSDWVRSVVDQLAAEGYIAIAPDLLSGTAPGGGGTDKYADVDAVRKAITSLPQEQITGDLNAVADYVSKLPAANDRLVVGGFCWGGAQTFLFAANNKKIKQAFVFYGNPPAESDMTRISAPIYGFYGENDERINATIPATIAAMKKLGKIYEPRIYRGAGHGFMRSGQSPDGSKEDRVAREDAWKRWRDLLKRIGT